MIVLGIHTSYNSKIHDPSACIFINGKLIFAIEEERLNRIKTSIGHFPERAIFKCLEFANIKIEEVDYVASDGVSNNVLQEKIINSFNSSFGFCPKIKLYDHSLCHNIASFIFSNFDESLSISFDGLGDGVSTKVIKFKKENRIIKFQEIEKLGSQFSLGNFYTAFTNYLGFKSIEGEFKVMGMSAYGTPKYDLSYFLSYEKGNWNNNNFNTLFDVKNYSSIYESSCNEDNIFKLTKVKRLSFNQNNYAQEHFDLASSVQNTFEKNYIGFIKDTLRKHNSKNLCLSGGCALNCLANNKLYNLDLENFYIYPASSDRGLCAGAAALLLNENNIPIEPIKDMYLGLSYSNDYISKLLNKLSVKFQEISNFEEDCLNSVQDGNIIAINNGRSEFGPRALGHRSIIASPSIKGMKDKINSKIKFREKFRPFAPMILENELEYEKEINQNNYYMTIASNPSDNLKKKIYETVHFDGTSRIQTVKQSQKDQISNLLNYMQNNNFFPALINTSFNVNGEPIVESPLDSVKTFFGSGLDILYINNFKIEK